MKKQKKTISERILSAATALAMLATIFSAIFMESFDLNVVNAQDSSVNCPHGEAPTCQLTFTAEDAGEGEVQIKVTGWTGADTLSLTDGEGNPVETDSIVTAGDTITPAFKNADDEYLYYPPTPSDIKVPDTLTEAEKTETVTVELTYINYYDTVNTKLKEYADIATPDDDNKIIHHGDTIKITPKFGYTVTYGGESYSYGTDAFIKYDASKVFETIEETVVTFADDKVSNFISVNKTTGALSGQTVTITVNEDYRIPAEAITVTYGGNTSTLTEGSGNTFTFEFPSNENVVISLDYEKIEYKIKTEDNSDGKVILSTDPTDYCAKGKDVTITATTVAGYKLAEGDITVTATTATTETVTVKKTETEGKYTFTMPESPVTITTAGASLYKVSVGTQSNATIKLTSGEYAKKDSDVTFTVSTPEGYALAEGDVTYTDDNGDNVTVSGNNGNYSFTMPDYPVTIDVTASLCKVSVRTQKNAAVKLTSDEYAKKDSDVTFTVTPADGYALAKDDVTVTDANGDEVTVTGSNGNYTFKMPDCPVNIDVTASLYKVTVSGTNAVVKLTSELYTQKGNDVTFTVTPNNGYYIEDSKITVTDNNGGNIKFTNEDGIYTFTMPDCPVTVSAAATLVNGCDLTVNEDFKSYVSVITPTDSNPATYTVEVEGLPEGIYVDEVSFGDEAVQKGQDGVESYTHTFGDLHEDPQITVTFKVKVDLKVLAGNGTIGKVAIPEIENFDGFIDYKSDTYKVTITAEPGEGYYISGLADNKTDVLNSILDDQDKLISFTDPRILAEKEYHYLVSDFSTSHDIEITFSEIEYDVEIVTTGEGTVTKGFENSVSYSERKKPHEITFTPANSDQYIKNVTISTKEINGENWVEEKDVTENLTYKNDGSATINITALVDGTIKTDIKVNVTFEEAAKDLTVDTKLVNGNIEDYKTDKYIVSPGTTVSFTVTNAEKIDAYYCYKADNTDPVKTPEYKSVLDTMTISSTCYVIIYTRTGNVVRKAVLHFVVDGGEPKLTVTKTGTLADGNTPGNIDDNTFLFNTVITVTASETFDETNSGINKITYYINDKEVDLAEDSKIYYNGKEIGTITAEDSEESGTLTYVITIDKDFSGTVKFTAYDSVLNTTSDEVVVKNDITKPELTVSKTGTLADGSTPEKIGDDTFLNKTVITVEAAETPDADNAKSGVNKITYYINDKEVDLAANSIIYFNEKEIGTIAASGSKESGTLKYVITIDKDFSGTVKFTAYDSVLNTNSDEVVVKNDITKPELTVTKTGTLADGSTPEKIDDNTFLNSTVITVDATEIPDAVNAKSGLNKITYYINDNEVDLADNSVIEFNGKEIGTITAEDSEESGTLKYVFTIDKNFTGTIQFTAYDNALNTNSDEVVVKNDITKPDISSSGLEVKDANDNFSEQISNSELFKDKEQAPSVGYKTSFSVTTSDPNNNDYNDETFTVPSNVKLVEYSFKGVNSKGEEVSGYKTLKDGNIENAEVLISEKKDGGETFGKINLVVENAKNNQDQTYTYNVSFGNQGDSDFIGTIYFYSKDNAGNRTEELKVNVHNITSAPSVTINNQNEEKTWKRTTIIDVDAFTNTADADTTVAQIQYRFDETDDNGWITINKGETKDVSFKEAVIGSAKRVGDKLTVTVDKDYRGIIYFRAINSLGTVSEVDSYTVQNDSSSPVISDVKVTKADNATAEDKQPRSLMFGLFNNKSVKVSATVTDLISRNRLNGVDDLNASGTAAVYLYDGTDLIGEMKRVGNSSEYVLEIPLNRHYTNIHFVADDAVGNRIGNVNNNSDQSLGSLMNLTHSRIMTEDIKSAIEIVALDMKNFVIVGGLNWVSDTFKYAVDINDPNSGINNIGINISNTSGQSSTQKFVDESVDLSSQNKETNSWSKEYSVSREGENNIDVAVEDNAYNTVSDSVKIYIDKTAPVVTGFEFTEPGNKESDSDSNPNIGVKTTDYGFYFSKTTDVRVFVKDGINSSSIGSITFYKIPEGESTRTDVITVDVSGSNAGNWRDGYTASALFTVEAGFKGQIYAVVTDRVNNSSETGNDQTNAHPDGTVIETQTVHDNTAIIGFDRQTTTMKDINGLDLYAADQKVIVSVSDPISGIKTVEWTVENSIDGVTQSGVLNIDNSSAFSGDSGWEAKLYDNNLVTSISKTLNINENRNGIKITVKLTDRAGNVSENSTELSIDKTVPTIDITYNDIPSTQRNGTTFYNKDRIATIVVTERNFSLDEIPEITIGGGTAEISSWTKISDNANDPDSDQWSCTVTFAEDADYTFAVAYTDLADNTTSKTESDFTMDQTAPVISLTFDNTSFENGNYYKDVRTATITVIEHDFEESDVVISMDSFADDNVTETDDPGVSAWSNEGDKHTAVVKYTDSGKFIIGAAYVDLANNAAEDVSSGEFYIDLVDPVFEIDGVEENTAYDGEIAPSITFSDYNLYGSDNEEYIEHTSVSFNRISMNGYGDSNVIERTNQQYDPASAENGYINSYVLSYDSFEENEDIDGIYVLDVTVYDKSGRSATKEIVFSVNRFGSTYRIVNQEAIDLLDNYNNGIYSNTEVPIVVEEINVTPLDDSAMSITVIANENRNTDLTLGQDYTVDKLRGRDDTVLSNDETRSADDSEERAEGWYAYYYNINADNFANDARYQVNISSRDGNGLEGASHQSANSTPVFDERICPINFIIDKTIPEVVIAGVSNDQNVEEASVDLTITCSDLHLSSPEKISSDYLEVIVNDEVKKIEDLKISTNDSDDIIISLPVLAEGSNAKQNVVVRVKDLAGNWSDRDDESVGSVSFTLSATWLKRLIDNTPLFITILVLLVLLIIGIVIFIIFLLRRRRR